MDVVARLRAAGCVFAEREAELLQSAATGRDLDVMVRRRVDGEPLEYVLGWAEFRGRRYALEPGVFVPRHRSELLVEQAIETARAGAVLVDLCCGCGALGEAVRTSVAVDLHAADVDPVAVRCARRNVHGAVYEGDLFTALPARLRGRIDVLLVNAPYVPTDAIAFLPADFRDHEARAALDGGADGTAVQRRVLAQASRWLAPGGVLLTETSPQQGVPLAEAAAAAGLETTLVTALGTDEDDSTTVLRARRSG